MEVDIICNGERVNSFDGRKWENPFVEIPQVGDFIELGAHELEAYEPQPMKRYEVVKRIFSAVMTYNRRYSQKKCVLEVREVDKK